MIDECIKQLEASGDYRIVKRFKPVESYHSQNEASKRMGIFLDTETTGLDVQADKVIELAMVPFEFDASGNIYRLLPEYNGLNDPGMPIPEIAQQITGITDDMVKGQSLDLDAVRELLSKAALVIAHNARFDRPFCEKILDEFKDISWACSIADVNWQEEGVEGVKLEFLAYKYGFFFEGHRATIDCQAGIEILSNKLPVSGEPVLRRLLENARQNNVRIWAEGSPFDKKDELKKRGYRWSAGDAGKRKAWYKDLLESELDEEMVFLSENIYQRSIDELPTQRFNAMIRYSDRL